MSHNKSSAQTARNKARLLHLLSNPHNRFCADCKTSRNPRWASWNLGVFICIRCSGIHRSLGTHISRVKSVDLDSWTDEQTANMELWGNEKGNLYWESKLFEANNTPMGDGHGAGYVPQDGKIESFVRTKYVLGKWKKDVDRESYASSSASSSSLSVTPSATTSTPTAQKANLLDDLLGNSNKVEQSRFQANVVSAPKSKVNPTVDLLRQSTAGSQSSQLPIQSNQSTGGSVSRGDLKKNILSLYSTPTNSNNNLASRQFQAAPAHPMHTSSTSSINGSVSGNSSQTNVWGSAVPSQREFVGEDPFRNVWQ